MGIEPTRDPCGPHAGFEDQERHQTPVTSAVFGRGALYTNRGKFASGPNVGR